MEIFTRLSAIVGGKGRHDVIERVVDSVLPTRKQKLHPVILSYLCKDNGVVLSTLNAASVVYRGKFDWANESSPRITLREDNNYRRKHFTLAHEMGHWITQSLLPDLRHESYRLSADKSPECEEEKLADEIALELLMPRSVFDVHARRKCSLQSLDKLCDVFQVQRAVALQRLSMLADSELLYAIIVPTLPTKLDSYAVIDEALVSRPSGNLDHVCDDVETVSPISFSTIKGKIDLALNVQGEIRSYVGECQYLEKNYPSVHFFGELQKQQVGKVGRSAAQRV